MKKIAVLSLAACLVQLAVFYCIGSLIGRAGRRESAPPAQTLVTGFCGYFCVFEGICFLCEVLLVPLHVLAALIAVLCAASVAAALFLCRKMWRRERAMRSIRRKRHGGWLYVLLAVIGASCLFALLYTDSSADAAWYVGTSSTAVYTDTIGRFSPTTGFHLTYFKPRYAFAMYPFHNAVMAQLFHIPAIVQARSVMSVINMLMAELSCFLLGMTLFGKNERPSSRIVRISQGPEAVRVQRADMFVTAVFILNVFSSAIYLPGVFLLTRSYEGKALIANLCILLTLAVCVRFYDGSAEENGAMEPACGGAGGQFLQLFGILLAGVCFSASVIIPMILAWAALLPLSIVRRKGRWVLGLILGTSPVLLWAALYYMASHGILVLSAVR